MGEPEAALVAATAAWVRTRMAGEGSHDWFHVERVWSLARSLVDAESVPGSAPGRPIDRLVELAALLHDIADAKFHGGDEALGPRLAREWLESLADPYGRLGRARIEHIAAIIATMSFRHGRQGFVPNPEDREYALVRDADRLDAMGAIGIARAFAYGGLTARPLHDPEAGQSAPTSLNHFYDKLLLLKDLMLTASGRAMALERHAFMQSYVARFLAEWEGRL
jgi:uncharacterized protein